MEHRVSRHPVEDHRAGDKIGPEEKLFMSTYAPHHETDEGDDEVRRKSKGEKHKRKRKREDSNIVSRKRHTQRLPLEDHHSGSRTSSKRKTKHRFSRWKSRRGSDNDHSNYDSSDSSMGFRRSDDSSYSGTRKKGHRKFGSRVHSEVDPGDGTCAKDNWEKESKSEGLDGIRFVSSKGDENEAQLPGNTAEIICEKMMHENESFERETQVAVEGQHNEIIDGKGSRAVGQAKQHLSVHITGEEAGLGNAGTKAENLEIELRQRALANLRKHRTTNCEGNEHNEIADSTTFMKDAKKGEVVVAEVAAKQNQQSTLGGEKESPESAGKTSHLLSVGNILGGDGIDVDEDRWPLASDNSPEPDKNMVEQSTTRSLMPVKSLAFGESLIETESSVEKGKINEGNTVQLTTIRQLQVPLESKIQPGKENNSIMVESSKNSDLHIDVLISAEANTVVMANGNSEPDKSGNLQVESKGSFDTSDITWRDGMSDIGECLSARESQIDAGGGNVVEASAATFVDQNSQSEKSLTKDCGAVSSLCATTSEIAVGKQEDAASMFQQKTMSVMRGGELVQVNYKVYIPKRAAELAKRRLQR